jgi:hypothetical protein
VILALPAVVGGQYRDHPDNHQTTGATTMTRYTAFCIDLTASNAPVWIDRVDAETEEDALDIAETKCAYDWEYDAKNVRCIGLVEGDVKVAYWHPDH